MVYRGGQGGAPLASRRVCFQPCSASSSWDAGDDNIQRTQISNWRDRTILESTHKSFRKVGGFFGLSLMLKCVIWLWVTSSVTETSQVAIWRTSKRSCEMGGPHATKLDVFCASTRRQKSGWAWRRLTGDRASPIIPIIPIIPIVRLDFTVYPNGMIHWVMGEVCAHPQVAKVPHHQTTASLKAVWQKHFWLKPDIFLTWNILKWYINIHHADIS